LWPSSALSGFKSRIRLKIKGINLLSAMIRIDEREDGRFRGRALLIQRRRDRRTGTLLPPETSELSFRPSAEQMRELRAKIVAAKLWRIYPQHWVNDDICIDGEQLAFERLDAEGYRFSEANAQCTAPEEVIEVARAMIRMAGVRRAEKLLL
jgi:hypothetical protein